jgi:1-acyl-sn-glycerol-3-phosphate acyltransferase
MYWIHRLTIFLLRGPVYLFLRLRVNYRRHRPGRIAGPFVVVSNHNTDLDPLLVISAFRQHMYAVGSEHIFRRGFVTALLKFFFDPVARPKGSRATVTAIEMLRRLREGRSLCSLPKATAAITGSPCPSNPPRASF